MRTLERPKIGRVAGKDYVTLEDIAELLGVKHHSAQVYHQRATRNRRAGEPRPGDLPEPDARFGKSPVWERRKIVKWMEKRPGRGAGGGTASAETRARLWAERKKGDQ